jgi:hypothetical protein
MIAREAAERRKEPSMKPPLFLVLVLNGAVLLAGCRQSVSAPDPAAAVTTSAAIEVRSSTPDIEPCALLSHADVESIFGTLKRDPKSDQGLREEKQCRYQNTDGQWLKVSLYGADRWELEKGIVSEQHPAPITSLGDEAFSVKQGTDSVIYVRKGGGVLEISCSCGLPKARAIAGNAIVKL